jgi:cytochrome c
MRYLLPLVALLLSVPAAADEARGKRLFLQCQACHSLGAGAAHKIGPNLHGVIGAKAATRAGYSYSPALTKANLVWDDPTLDRWLARPGAMVPGNKMVFGGVAKAEDRAQLIAYLKRMDR